MRFGKAWTLKGKRQVHVLKLLFSKVKLVILAAVLFIAVRGGLIKRCCAKAANSLAVCVKKVAIFKRKGSLTPVITVCARSPTAM